MEVDGGTYWMFGGTTGRPGVWHWDVWMGNTYCVTEVFPDCYWDRIVFDQEEWVWMEDLGTAQGSGFDSPGVIQVGRRRKRSWIETFVQPWDVGTEAWSDGKRYLALTPSIWENLRETGLRLKNGKIMIGGLGGRVWDFRGEAVWTPERYEKEQAAHRETAEDRLSVFSRETRLGF